MNRRVSAFWTLALACAPLACTPAHDTPEQMKAAADSVDTRFLAAVNSADVDSLMATYWNSPELVSVSLDGMGVRGWTAVREGWAAMLQTMPGARMEFTSQNNEPQGDVVAGWGTWRMTIPTPDGAAVEMTGRYTDIKARRDGRWVYVLDHASVPLPPAR